MAKHETTLLWAEECIQYYYSSCHQTMCSMIFNMDHSQLSRKKKTSESILSICTTHKRRCDGHIFVSPPYIHCLPPARTRVYFSISLGRESYSLTVSARDVVIYIKHRPIQNSKKKGKKSYLSIQVERKTKEERECTASLLCANINGPQSFIVGK